jgi:hypothetical protein
MSESEFMLNPSDWNPRRVLVTGYFDGPTAGIIDFGAPLDVFCFDEMAFDSERATRVSRLSAVPSDAFEPIVDALSLVFGPPKWPFWIPIWQFADESGAHVVAKREEHLLDLESMRQNIESQIDALCATAKVTLAVLTDESLEKCFGVRRLDQSLPSSASDWLHLFE